MTVQKKEAKSHKVIIITNTVKPVYINHPGDPEIMADIERWSLFRDHLCSKSPTWVNTMVVFIGRWSLFGGGR